MGNEREQRPKATVDMVFEAYNSINHEASRFCG